jgi:uncharacterized lipoprotein YddW (UPF0748 family)
MEFRPHGSHLPKSDPGYGKSSIAHLPDRDKGGLKADDTEVFPIFKKAFPLILAASLFVSLGGGCKAQKPEFRAMWVTAWQSGLLTPAEVDETIRLAKLANLNALIVQVRKTGDAYYISDYEPRGDNLTLPDYDPLDYIVKQAHASGLEVHVWMNTYKIWQGKKPPVSPEHVFNKHPEWISRSITGALDADGQYALDPGILEVQEYTRDIYLDCVRKYDVDGIHFDYVRYWGRNYGYSNLAVARFNREAGRTGIPKPDDPEWCQWRRDRVTALVRDVYTAVKAVKPEVKVTAAVMCGGECSWNFRNTYPYKSYLQDWERWLREGIVDAVIPMNYRSEGNAKYAAQFRDWTKAAVRLRNGRQIYNGILTDRTNYLVTQIKATRISGADGIVGFHFNASADRDGIALALRQEVFQTPAPTPPMTWKPAQSPTVTEASTDPKELLSSAISLASKGDLDRAIELLKRSIEADPDFADAHYRLGCYYQRKGMKDEASAEYRETLRIRPGHGGASVALSRISRQ